MKDAYRRASVRTGTMKALREQERKGGQEKLREVYIALRKLEEERAAELYGPQT